MMPWKLLSDFSAYIFGWLVGYSGLLGPIAGIMIADYFIVRRRELVVDDLYRRNGIYEYYERHQLSRAGGAGGGNRGGAARAGGSGVTLALRLRLVRRIPGRPARCIWR